jgi:uncharacterized surface protein with fasciclin (FAS1) repeats
MKNIAKLLKLTLFVATTAMIFSCSDDESALLVVEDNTIVGIASRTPDFSSLVAAIQRTGLTQTLSQTNALTVFAPDNTAFTAFLTANNFANLEAVPIPLLTEILKNHVVAGTNLSTGLPTGYVKTLGKGSASASNTLSMFINKGVTPIRINGVSNVVTADIIASNGVIHRVSSVIGLPTIVTHAAANPLFSTLATVVTSAPQAAVLTALTTNATPLTVFAPTDAAFTTALGAGGFANGATDAQVTKVLQYHVTGAGNVLSTTLTNGQVIPMVTSPIQNVTVDLNTPTSLRLQDTTPVRANIIAVDVQCANGIIHAVDKVLQPVL